MRGPREGGGATLPPAAAAVIASGSGPQAPGARPGEAGALAWLRTGAFYLYIALATVALGAWGLPQVLANRRRADRVAQVWSDHFLAALRVIAGLSVEVRGTPPAGPALVASKHQSFLDIMGISAAVPRRGFVMKRQVLRVPIMGWFARAAGCIPIDRTRGGKALAEISAEVARSKADGGLGQIVIYPEGTRTLPGERLRYKYGVAALAEASGLPVTPVAVNAGLFWPRKGYPLRPGRAVIAFLPVMPEALSGLALVEALQQVIEGGSDALMAEAGFTPAQPAPLPAVT